jgi:hypothetical protein
MWSSLVASRSGGYPMLSHDPGECPPEMDNQGRVTGAIGMPTARRAGTSPARMPASRPAMMPGHPRPQGNCPSLSGGSETPSGLVATLRPAKPIEGHPPEAHAPPAGHETRRFQSRTPACRAR